VAKTLVTGASGFIGSNLAHALIARGDEVICLTRRPLAALEQAGAQVVHSLDGVRAERVFHLAAAGVSAKDRKTTPLLDGNVGLVARLLESVADWPLTHFVHTGSCSEYGPVASGVLLTEDHAIRPESMYGAAKAASSLVADALARRLGLPFVSLRLFGVYGPGEAPSRLLPTLLSTLRGTEVCRLTPGRQVRDFTFITDVVQAFILAGTTQLDERAYNVCSGAGVTIRTVAREAASLLEVPDDRLQFGALPYRDDEPMWIVGDRSRFSAATGWEPRVGLRAGIERMLESTHE
jgi:nucleoside-diphosphate-sugar epimerase